MGKMFDSRYKGALLYIHKAIDEVSAFFCCLLAKPFLYFSDTTFGLPLLASFCL